MGWFAREKERCLALKTSWKFVVCQEQLYGSAVELYILTCLHNYNIHTLGQPLSQIAAAYGVGKSTLYDIVKNEEKFKTFQTELIECGDCIKKEDCQKNRFFLNLTGLSISGSSMSNVRVPQLVVHC